MKEKFDIQSIANFMVALNSYRELANHLPQIDPSQKEALDSIWTQEGKFEGKYWESPVLKHWEEIDIHITQQMWGSTSCGWGGMGGAAMTSTYNYVIHQKYTDLLYVYWHGKLAYIVKRSEIADLSRLPGIGGYTQRERNVKFVFKNTNRK